MTGSSNVDVEKNTSDTVKKDVNVVDENGDGVLSITKTPFEITMKMQDPEAKYFCSYAGCQWRYHAIWRRVKQQ